MKKIVVANLSLAAALSWSFSLLATDHDIGSHYHCDAATGQENQSYIDMLKSGNQWIHFSSYYLAAIFYWHL